MKFQDVFKIFQEVTEADPANAKVLPALPNEDAKIAKVDFSPGGNFPKVQVTTPARPRVVVLEAAAWTSAARFNLAGSANMFSQIGRFVVPSRSVSWIPN